MIKYLNDGFYPITEEEEINNSTVQFFSVSTKEELEEVKLLLDIEDENMCMGFHPFEDGNDVVFAKEGFWTADPESFRWSNVQEIIEAMKFALEEFKRIE